MGVDIALVSWCMTACLVIVMLFPNCRPIVSTVNVKSSLERANEIINLLISLGRSVSDENEYRLSPKLEGYMPLSSFAPVVC